MPKTCLIGHSGFVGSNLKRQKSFDDFYRSTDIDGIRGKDYSLLVCCGISAAKWLANKDPEGDRAAIHRLIDNLSTVTAEQVILISTVDVYPVADGVDETYDCASVPNHAYGTNRLAAEKAFSALFKNLSIVRLPGLFGRGLKKNVIFDLLRDNCLEMINPQSVFQFYDMSAIGQDTETILRSQVPLVNLATEPIPTKNIIAAFFPDKTVGQKAVPAAAYDIRTRYGKIFNQPGKYRFTAAEVMLQLENYIRFFRDGGEA
jgi:hypothetical protein